MEIDEFNTIRDSGPMIIAAFVIIILTAIITVIVLAKKNKRPKEDNIESKEEAEAKT